MEGGRGRLNDLLQRTDGQMDGCKKAKKRRLDVGSWAMTRNNKKNCVCVFLYMKMGD